MREGRKTASPARGGIADLPKVGKEEEAYTGRVRCEEVKVVEEAFVEKRGFRERGKQYHF